MKPLEIALTGIVLLMGLLSFYALAGLDLPAPLGFACYASISAFVTLWVIGLFTRPRHS